MTSLKPGSMPNSSYGNSNGAEPTHPSKKPVRRAANDKLGLRLKILLAALLLSTVPLIVASVIVPRRVQATVTDQGLAHLRQVANDLAGLAHTEVERNIETVRGLSKIDSLASAVRRRNAGELSEADAASVTRQLGAVLGELATRHQGIFMAGTDGRIFSGILKSGRTDAYSKINLLEREYYQQVRAQKKAVVSNPLRSVVDGVPIIVVAAPFLDEAGEFAGMLGLSIEIEYLANVISSQKLGERGYPFAIDRLGNIFAHPDRSRVLTVNLSTVAGTMRLSDRMRKGEIGVEEYTSYTGARKLATFAPVPISGWSIGASMETDEFVAPARQLRQMIYVLIGACILLAVLVALILSEGFEKLKASLAETRRNAAELSVINNNAPLMMFLLDADRRIRRANRAARAFGVIKDEQIAGLRVGEFLGCIHAHDDERGCGHGLECDACKVLSASRSTLVNRETPRKLEATMRLQRGNETTEVVLLTSTAALEIDGETLVLLCIEDITAQKRAQDRIREQAALLDVTQDAVCVFDLDGFVTYWNKSAERIYGWTAAEAVGQSMPSLLALSADSAAYTTVQEAVWNKGEWSGELNYTDRSGQRRILQCRLNLVRDAEGGPNSILGVASDVTEARRLEAQFLRAQRLESVGELATGIAHDLNNVLAPILMTAPLLEPLARNQSDRDTLRLINESAKRGAAVVRQLLLFGRGTDEPRREISAQAVIEEVLRMLKTTFPRTIHVGSEVAADLRTVIADSTQLHQVLLNLCVNARDAMPTGGTLRLTAKNRDLDETFARTRPGAKPGAYIEIRVVDTGSGIPAPVLEKIFDPFFTTKERGRGTGLGLSSALGIVRSHGGFITVDSNVGTGTEFAVYLPAAHAPVQSAPPADQTDAVDEDLILVVDDERSIRDMLKGHLEHAGYRTAVACDGVEALALLSEKKDRIRLVVTDLMLPGMNGVEIIQTVRAHDATLPFIALSGSQDLRTKLKEANVAGVTILAKPFASTALLAAVKTAFAIAQTAR